MLKARWNARQNAGDTQIPASTRVLAIASGKGGVGKSSVTVNLAVALAKQGRTVGVLDADIWGFSIPRLLGMSERLEATKDDETGRAADRAQRAVDRPREAQGGVDRVPRRRGHRADVARPDADEGRRAVPARRAMGRPRRPADRHAARHRRRPDGAVPTAPARRHGDRHDAGARRPEGRPARRRHGPAQLRACRRRGREHELRSSATTASRTRCSARAAARRSPTTSVCRCSARCRSNRRSPPAATPDDRSRSTTRHDPAARAFIVDRRSPRRGRPDALPPGESLDMAGCSARMLAAVEAALDA